MALVRKVKCVGVNFRYLQGQVHKYRWEEWKMPRLPAFLEICRNKRFQKQQFADIIQNRWAWKFCNIHRKTPVSV